MIKTTIFILFNTFVISQACQRSILGFKYVPPADSKIDVVSTATSNRQTACVPCKRGIGLSEGPSSKFLWGTTAAPTTTTTSAPCCADTGAKLQNATACGAATTRIVGGVDATENQLPWQCTFYKTDGTWYGCGGTIINCNPTIIVSAAHCFQGQTPARVTCGDWKLDATDTDEQSLVVSSVVNHPSYNAATFENDIAVVKVTGTMTCAQGKIWPACLPNTAKYTYEGWADTVVSGWGTISSGGAISNTLKYVKVPPVSDATCNAAASYAGSIVSDQMICAGLAAGGKDACQGDSGGPLVTKATGVDTGYSLIGVVSFGNGCAAANFYGVYAEFSNYMEWVATQFGLTL